MGATEVVGQRRPVVEKIGLWQQRFSACNRKDGEGETLRAMGYAG